MRVAIATAAAARGLDDDEPALVEAMSRVGVAAEPAVWDDPLVDWGRYDLVVVRSTWDYPPRREEFLAWADEVATVTRLANPADVLRWNTDKRYLRDLAAAGVPVVATEWREPGDEADVPGWDELVVKPAVSVGARDTARYGRGQGDAARAHVEDLLRDGRTAMIQPYVAAVDEAGETALVFIAGEYSHAIAKAAILRPGTGVTDGLFAPEEITVREPTPAEHELARATLAAVPAGAGRLLYARVDVVTDGSGAPLLLELELTEPSLFLTFADGAAAGLASAIAAAAATR